MKGHVLVIEQDGTALIIGGGFDDGVEWDYHREMKPDEVVDGQKVRDYPIGSHPVKDLPPENRGERQNAGRVVGGTRRD